MQVARLEFFVALPPTLWQVHHPLADLRRLNQPQAVRHLEQKLYRRRTLRYQAVVAVAVFLAQMMSKVLGERLASFVEAP